jgi:hypothetical protein
MTVRRKKACLTTKKSKTARCGYDCDQRGFLQRSKRRKIIFKSYRKNQSCVRFQFVIFFNFSQIMKPNKFKFNQAIWIYGIIFTIATSINPGIQAWSEEDEFVARYRRDVEHMGRANVREPSEYRDI